MISDKTNSNTPTAAQQPTASAVLFISLHKRFRGSESDPIYVNPEEISLIEPWSDDGSLIRLRNVATPFKVDESPDSIRGLIDGRIFDAAQGVRS